MNVCLHPVGDFLQQTIIGSGELLQAKHPITEMFLSETNSFGFYYVKTAL